ncbi:mechanosensitive ion channel family protein [Dysgonomonas sp. 520]|uniref:mechanosensitive ion channel family protein n=1 Tax=Dysgonomonas sp. 520 TaxID=2302931 RepID=UPI0013D786CB|nr:mechanosensitive ion channel domain-containing protein [Dysgonomonas sp. 520]NDW10654.1 mechanosensitive ion channel protein MscS [Dysgonomonas sp. 520]
MEPEILDKEFNTSANAITQFTRNLLHGWGVPEGWISFVNLLLLLIIVIVIVVILQKLIDFILNQLFKRIEKITHLKIFSRLQKNKFSFYLGMVVPYTFIVNAIPTIFADYPSWISPLMKLADVYIAFMIVWTLMSVIRSFADVLQEKPAFHNRPMKSYLQVIQIILYIFVAVAIYSIITGKSATAFFAAMGAASAVLMLMFQDTIKGFAASIQISSNKTVMIGDWITMNKYGADGNVEEINLSNVRVRNFDKTITTIPTYSLVSDSFQNWRGMQESGGRRLKRSLIIKQLDIRFLTDEELDKYQSLPPFKGFLKEKRSEYDNLNKKLGIGKDSPLLGYRLTNCDLFVQYATWYLQNNPNINQNMTLMVRQLAPSTGGLPIELYTFTNTTVWLDYERISGEVINHLITIVRVFGLTILETPSSTDSLTIEMNKKNE